MKGKPVEPKKVGGMKIKGKPTKPKKKKPRTMAEHTRSLKAAIKY